MKRLFQIKLVVLGFLFMPVTAYAGFFDDGRWYMDSSHWDEVVVGDVSRTNLSDSGDRLNWETSGWTDGQCTARAKIADWAFDLRSDFDFSVNFRYSHTDTYFDDEGGIGVDLHGDYNPSGICVSGIYAENWSTSTMKNLFRVDVDAGGAGGQGTWWQRLKDNGMFSAHYDAAQDKLSFCGYEWEGSQMVLSNGMSYYGLRETVGVSALGLVFSGWSQGAGLIAGDAYLENFQVNSGVMTVTPEPVSSVLFLFGAGGLFIRRFRRKRTV